MKIIYVDDEEINLQLFSLTYKPTVFDGGNVLTAMPIFVTWGSIRNCLMLSINVNITLYGYQNIGFEF